MSEEEIQAWKPMVVVAIDPGITTGVAARLDGPEGRRYSTFNINPIDDLWGLLMTLHPDLIILEQFAASGRIDENCERTLEACGWVKAYCHVYKVRMVTHTPSYRISFLKLAKEFLRMLAQSQKRDSRYPITDHEFDAMSHIMRWEDNIKKGDPRALPELPTI